MEFISWGKKLSSADAAMEQAYSDVHLRALYVLADLGRDHSIGWDGRTPQGDQQEPTVFL